MKPTTRGPRWRYELADKYADKGNHDIKQVKFAKNEDALVKTLTKYLCKERSGIAGRLLSEEFPYIHEAYTLDADRDTYSDVWVVEALVLTDMSDKAVAKYMAYEDPKIIGTFCDCFYDLRDKGIKERYSRIIRNVCRNNSYVTDYDYTWKYLAIGYGFETLCRVAFQRFNMTEEDMELLHKAKSHDKMYISFATLNTLAVNPLQIRSEEELLRNKQNLDLDEARKKTEDEEGDAQEEMVHTLESVEKELMLLTPGPCDDPNEKRLTKKRK
jgi:hypothetical protein